MKGTGGQSFDLTFALLGTSGRWTPREGEVRLCRDIVALVVHPIPAREEDPLARYVTMAGFFSEALAAVRAMPPEMVPAGPDGALPTDSLSVFLAEANVAANDIVRTGYITTMSEDSVRECADDLLLAVVGFRRAIGIVGGADESFWTPSALGEGSLYSLRPPEPATRRRWWQRR